MFSDLYDCHAVWRTTALSNIGYRISITRSAFVIRCYDYCLLTRMAKCFHAFRTGTIYPGDLSHRLTNTLSNIGYEMCITRLSDDAFVKSIPGKVYEMLYITIIIMWLFNNLQLLIPQIIDAGYWFITRMVTALLYLTQMHNRFIISYKFSVDACHW